MGGEWYLFILSLKKIILRKTLELTFGSRTTFCHQHSVLYLYRIPTHHCFLRIWSHLLKKSLIENFIFWTVPLSPGFEVGLEFGRIRFMALSWRSFLSNRNQSMDLLCQSMDWFLYDRDFRHERVKDYYAIKKLSYVVVIIFRYDELTWINFKSEKSPKIEKMKSRNARISNTKNCCRGQFRVTNI